MLRSKGEGSRHRGEIATLDDAVKSNDNPLVLAASDVFLVARAPATRGQRRVRVIRARYGQSRLKLRMPALPML